LENIYSIHDKYLLDVKTYSVSFALNQVSVALESNGVGVRIPQHQFFCNSFISPKSLKSGKGDKAVWLSRDSRRGPTTVPALLIIQELHIKIKKKVLKGCTGSFKL
jgi:hypothetical protein